MQQHEEDVKLSDDFWRKVKKAKRYAAGSASALALISIPWIKEPIMAVHHNLYNGFFVAILLVLIPATIIGGEQLFIDFISKLKKDDTK